MAIQKIFKAGNSNVVSIPSQILDQLDLKTGQSVSVDMQLDKIIISKPEKSAKKTQPSNKDLNAWWNEFIQENAATLDELALR